MSRHLLIFLDKSLFQIIFFLIVLLSKLIRRKKPEHYPQLVGSENFLVVRPGGIGDGIMSIPFLKALRKRFPKSKITLLCVQKNKAALNHLQIFDELVVLDNIGGLHGNIYKLYKSHFDVVFDLEPFRKISSVITFLSGARIRIGFDTNSRRLLYTHHVTYANEKCFESLNVIRQFEVFDIHVPQNEALDMSFPLPDEISQRATKTLQSHGLNSEKDFIVAIVPGVLKEHHRWIMPRFSSVITFIRQENPKTRILLLGAPRDLKDTNEVLQHIEQPEGIINLVGETDFMEALGILKVCKILIACDGGIVYMAAAMGCSTISLWGPGVMERFKPVGDNHIGIRKNYFCVPCVNYSRLGEFPDCPYDRKCIIDISAKDVFHEYVHLKTWLLHEKEGAASQQMI